MAKQPTCGERMKNPLNAVDRAIALLGGPTPASHVVNCAAATLSLDRRRGWVNNRERAEGLARATGIPLADLLGPVAEQIARDYAALFSGQATPDTTDTEPTGSV